MIHIKYSDNGSSTRIAATCGGVVIAQWVPRDPRELGCTRASLTSIDQALSEVLKHFGKPIDSHYIPGWGWSWMEWEIPTSNWDVLEDILKI